MNMYSYDRIIEAEARKAARPTLSFPYYPTTGSKILLSTTVDRGVDNHGRKKSQRVVLLEVPRKSGTEWMVQSLQKPSGKAHYGKPFSTEKEARKAYEKKIR